MNRPTPSDRPAAAPAHGVPEATHVAHVLAHRLRGLVAGIEGFADLLLEQLGQPEQRDLAMRILESAHRIEHVLADLKYFARPLSPRPADVPVPRILEALMSSLPDELAEQIQFDVIDARTLCVHADRYLVREALQLLLQNAVEAQSKAVRLIVHNDAESNQVHFDVWNGGELDVDVATQMFVPFFTTKARNLGVGLPMARRIARANGGDVSLVGSKSDGITLRLVLPASTR